MILLEDTIAELNAAMSEIENSTGHVQDTKIQFWIKEGLKLMEKAGEAFQNAVDIHEEAEI